MGWRIVAFWFHIEQILLGNWINKDKKYHHYEAQQSFVKHVEMRLFHLLFKGRIFSKLVIEGNMSLVA